MKRFFGIVSGENIELARAEIDALIQLVDRNLKTTWKARMVSFTGTSDPTQFLLKRAALLNEAGPILVEFPLKQNSIMQISSDLLKSHISPVQSFVVRTISLGYGRRIKEREQLTAKLGRYVKKETGARVSLKNPDVRLLAVITSDSVILCNSKKSQLRPQLHNRKPGKKPFFHPTIMNAILARVMCNLSRVKKDDFVVDPFCGGGGILCEALDIGAKVTGMDLNWRLLKGASVNLASMGKQGYCLIQGDVRHFPFSKCNSIITDPPYGRSSSTRGAHSIRLVESLIQNSIDNICKNGILCICASSNMGIPELLAEVGLKLAYHVTVRVHRRLIREVMCITV